MTFQICLQALLYGTLSYTAPTTTLTYDKNNGVFYNMFNNKTVYLIPDKYNLETLCNEPRRFAEVTKNKKNEDKDLLYFYGSIDSFSKN